MQVLEPARQPTADSHGWWALPGWALAASSAGLPRQPGSGSWQRRTLHIMSSHSRTAASRPPHRLGDEMGSACNSRYLTGATTSQVFAAVPLSHLPRPWSHVVGFALFAAAEPSPPASTAPGSGRPSGLGKQCGLISSDIIKDRRSVPSLCNG